VCGYEQLRCFLFLLGFLFFLALYEKQGTMAKGGGAVRNTKTRQQIANQAKNNAAVAAYKASGSPTFVPNQRELLAASIEVKRAEQASRAVVPEPIDEDPSPVLAESTLAPAPTTPLPATPLPPTPLPATPLPKAPVPMSVSLWR
jgi:hypothetical protein